jgi:Transmembrane secretion effector
MDDAVNRQENKVITDIPAPKTLVTLSEKTPKSVPPAETSETKTESGETPKVGMFTSFRHRNFRYFWTGAFISNLGNWMQTVGMNWLVLSLTNSPFLLGLVNFLGNAPMLFFSMFGGVMADRHSRKRILYITQTTMLTLVLILGILTFFGVIQIWMVVLISFSLGVAIAFNGPAYQTIMLDLKCDCPKLHAV